MAADGRQKPCLCPSSRRSLTKRYSGAAPTITSMRSAASSLVSDPSRTSECHVKNEIAWPTAAAVRALTTSLAASRHQ